MNYCPVTLKEAAKEEPVTLGDVKEHLRIDSDLTEDDAFLDTAIVAARTYVESTSNLALVTQKWTAWRGGFPGCSGSICLPKRPLVSVDLFRYRDTDGVLQTLANTEYQADTVAFSPRIVPAYGKSWPSGRCDINALQIDCTFGYGAAAKVPEPVKWAIKLLVGHMYEHREETVVDQFALKHIPMGVRHLLAPEAVMHC